MGHFFTLLHLRGGFAGVVDVAGLVVDVTRVEEIVTEDEGTRLNVDEDGADENAALELLEGIELLKPSEILSLELLEGDDDVLLKILEKVEESVLLEDSELLLLLEVVLEGRLEDVVEDVPIDEDDLAVSGTPLGPAVICRIFSGATELNTVGAREIWLLSKS